MQRRVRERSCGEIEIEGDHSMSLIRTDLNVSPSFSRSGKTAASVNAVAMGQLKKELDYASRKAELSKTANTLNATNKEILSKVLDVSITGAPPSCSKSRQLDMASREQDMASSPRAPSSWYVADSLANIHAYASTCASYKFWSIIRIRTHFLQETEQLTNQGQLR